MILWDPPFSVPEIRLGQPLASSDGDAQAFESLGVQGLAIVIRWHAARLSFVAVTGLSLSVIGPSRRQSLGLDVRRKKGGCVPELVIREAQSHCCVPFCGDAMGVQ